MKTHSAGKEKNETNSVIMTRVRMYADGETVGANTSPPLPRGS
jgi:hypothetical protein